jgi:hypothetical protein
MLVDNSPSVADFVKVLLALDDSLERRLPVVVGRSKNIIETRHTAKKLLAAARKSLSQP